MTTNASSRVLNGAGRLTATGAVAVPLALGLAGGLVDVLRAPALGAVFAVLFVLGCAAATWLVQRSDLATAVVMPPLVYVAVAMLTAPFAQSGRSGSLLVRLVLAVANAVVLGAPVLLTATAVTAAVAAARWYRRAPER